MREGTEYPRGGRETTPRAITWDNEGLVRAASDESATHNYTVNVTTATVRKEPWAFEQVDWRRRASRSTHIQRYIAQFLPSLSPPAFAAPPYGCVGPERSAHERSGTTLGLLLKSTLLSL